MELPFELVIHELGRRLGECVSLAFTPPARLSVADMRLTLPEDGTPESSALYVLSLEDAQELWRWGRQAQVVAVGDGTSEWAEALELGYGGDGIALATVDGPDSVVGVASVVSEVLTWHQRWDERLMEAVISRADIQAVMDIAAEAFDNPLALSDSSLTLIAAAGELPTYVTGTIWDRASERDFSPYDYYDYTERKLLAGLGAGSGALRMRPKKSPEHELVIAVAYAGSHMYGSIASLDIREPFPPGTEALISHVRDRIQQSVTLSDGYRHGGEELTYLLRRAIRGHRVDSGVLAFHLRKLGWDSGERLRIACLKPADAITDEGENDRHLSRVRRCLPKAVCLLNGDNVVALVRESSGELDARLGACARLERTIGDFGMHGGISLAFTSLEHLASYHAQALEAARVAESTAAERLLMYPDAFDLVLAGALLRETDLDTVCHPVVLQLAREGYKGDLDQSRELVRDLEAYLAYGRNGRLAAERLFMHRNTLVHRIKVLEGLLGFSLDALDARQMRFLEISCMLALTSGEVGPVR